MKNLTHRPQGCALAKQSLAATLAPYFCSWETRE